MQKRNRILPLLCRERCILCTSGMFTSSTVVFLNNKKKNDLKLKQISMKKKTELIKETQCKLGDCINIHIFSDCPNLGEVKPDGK